MRKGQNVFLENKASKRPYCPIFEYFAHFGFLLNMPTILPLGETGKKAILRVTRVWKQLVIRFNPINERNTTSYVLNRVPSHFKSDSDFKYGFDFNTVILIDKQTDLLFYEKCNITFVINLHTKLLTDGFHIWKVEIQIFWNLKIWKFWKTWKIWI